MNCLGATAARKGVRHGRRKPARSVPGRGAAGRKKDTYIYNSAKKLQRTHLASRFPAAAILLLIFISCRNGDVICDNNMNLNSIFFEWEQKTDSIIARIHVYDSSSVYLLYGDTQRYGEQYYIKNGVFREREYLMRAALPILTNTTDSTLIIEKYGIETNMIDIFCNETKYSYRFNTENHLPYCVLTAPTNVSDVINSVEKGFYVCYSQGVINDLCCITLITKQDKDIKTEILALTINEIPH